MNEKETTAEIVTSARVSINPDKRKELFLTISSLLGRVRSENGCRTYRFYRETSENDTFLLIGEWETLNDWIRYMNSDDFSVLMGCLEILGNNALEIRVLSQVDEIEALLKNETKNIGGGLETYDWNNKAAFTKS